MEGNLTSAGLDGAAFRIYDFEESTSNGRPHSVIGNPYMFQGQRYDEESALYYFKNRYYDPEHGRFLSRDPLGAVDGPNLYAFVNNNPINYVDPMGLYSVYLMSSEKQQELIKAAKKELSKSTYQLLIDMVEFGYQIHQRKDPYWLGCDEGVSVEKMCLYIDVDETEIEGQLDDLEDVLENKVDREEFYKMRRAKKIAIHAWEILVANSKGEETGDKKNSRLIARWYLHKLGIAVGDAYSVLGSTVDQIGDIHNKILDLFGVAHTTVELAQYLNETCRAGIPEHLLGDVEFVSSQGDKWLGKLGVAFDAMHAIERLSRGEDVRSIENFEIGLMSDFFNIGSALATVSSIDIGGLIKAYGIALPAFAKAVGALYDEAGFEQNYRTMILGLPPAREEDSLFSYGIGQWRLKEAKKMFGDE